MHVSCYGLVSRFLMYAVIGGLDVAGCWLIYKAMGEQAYELSSYELMSANDAPERDPKDWYI